jgi:hypothetical protein
LLSIWEIKDGVLTATGIWHLKIVRISYSGLCLDIEYGWKALDLACNNNKEWSVEKCYYVAL